MPRTHSFGSSEPSPPAAAAYHGFLATTALGFANASAGVRARGALVVKQCGVDSADQIVPGSRDNSLISESESAFSDVIQRFCV